MASCEASICEVATSWSRIEFDLDLLAERRPQQFGDVEHGAVDVDIARLQRLPAGEGEQMLDQLAAALRRLVDHLGGFLQRRPVLQARDQRFRGAGDHGQHVVEVVRDAAGQLADGVELLRLLQLALGLAPLRNVVIDQRRTADRAVGVAQRPAADDEIQRRAAVGGTDDDFLLVERLAAQYLLGRHLMGGQAGHAVGMIGDAQPPQLPDVHARLVAQQFRGGLVGEDDLAGGVEDDHGFSDAVEGVLQHRGRMPQLFVGGDQMLGAFGDRGLQRFVGGLRRDQRILQLAARSPRGLDQDGGEDENEDRTGKIDRQQEAPGGAGSGVAIGEACPDFGHGLFEVDADLFHRRAAFGTGHQRQSARGIARLLQPDHLAGDIDAANRERLGLLEQLLLRRTVLDIRDQIVEGGRNSLAGLAMFVEEIRVLAERKATGRTFGTP